MRIVLVLAALGLMGFGTFLLIFGLPNFGATETAADPIPKEAAAPELPKEAPASIPEENVVVVAEAAPIQQPLDQPISFDLPIPCQQGDNCWLFRFVDLDPSPGIRDFGCGLLADDGHKGTDFAIKDVHRMAAGVPVFAMAPGTVKAVRDGMADRDVSVAGYASVRGKDCGNGIVLSHEDGWETQYCHLRRTSVQVHKGQSLTRGEKIGFVGMSGAATFPHVHVTVRHKGQVVDPFSGVKQLADDQSCNTSRRALWSKSAARALGYQSPVIYAHGFASQNVNGHMIRQGYFREDTLPATAPKVTVWSYIAGLSAGNRVELGLREPGRQGFLTRSFDVTSSIDGGNQLMKWHQISKPRKNKAWAPGLYQGRVRVLSQSGQVLAEAFPQVTID